jgi:prophage regulatory protein
MVDFFELVKPVQQVPTDPIKFPRSSGARSNDRSRTINSERRTLCRVLVWGGELMPRQTKAPRFLRLPEVRQMTGLSTSTIYRWMIQGNFPKQIQRGSRSVVRNERDVIVWMDKQMEMA